MIRCHWVWRPRIHAAAAAHRVVRRARRVGHAVKAAPAKVLVCVATGGPLALLPAPVARAVPVAAYQPVRTFWDAAPIIGAPSYLQPLGAGPVLAGRDTIPGGGRQDVPEPLSAALFVLALAGLFVGRRVA